MIVGLGCIVSRSDRVEPLLSQPAPLRMMAPPIVCFLGIAPETCITADGGSINFLSKGLRFVENKWAVANTLGITTHKSQVAVGIERSFATIDVQVGKRLPVEEFVHVQHEVRQDRRCDWVCEDHIDGLMVLTVRWRVAES